MRQRRLGGQARRLLLVGLVAAMLCAGWWPASSRALAGRPVSVATPVTATPLVIDGDPITALAARSGAGVIFVTGARGLYRSTDGAVTWQVAGERPPAPLLAIGDDASLVLAGSDVPCGAAQPDATPLFRSRDGGTSWQVVTGVERLWPLAIWDTPAVALGATCAGLQVSIDEGQTWRSLDALPASLGVRAVARTAGRDGEETFLIVGTAERGMSALWLVTLGRGGELVSSQPLHTFWGAAAVGGSSQAPVIGTANGVLTTLDGGKTWRLSRAGLEAVTLSVDPTEGPIPDAELRRGYGITAVAVSAIHPERLYVGTIDGVYRSEDGGVTWSKLEGTAGLITALVLTAGRTLLVEGDAGVFAYAVPSVGDGPCHGTAPKAATTSLLAGEMASMWERPAHLSPQWGRS